MSAVHPRAATISPETTMQQQNKTIGVMGSGKEPWIAFAEPLGAWLA
ncbi:MAG: DNA-binding protein, partial [Burkholderia sp.]|nr:DNA-binding protein [Burkholderia sp.]